jgi:ABC-type transport system involved in multi-copper enzyme maturation permease subunit
MGVSAYHVRGGHLKLVAFHFARHHIRGGTGIMFTLTLLTVGLIIAAAFITPLEEMHKSVERQRVMEQQRRGIQDGRAITKKELVDEITRQIGKPVAEWATDDADQANFLVNDRPALVSAILMVLMFAMPFLVCLGSFNQLSGDIQSKGLRYLLLRTERANLFLGRFIGTLLFTMVVLAILLAVIFLYLAFKADFYPAGKVALWLLQGYVALMLFALPYIALCAWFSATIDSPFACLVICELVALVVPAFVAIGSAIEKNFKYIGYVMPWPLKYQLLHPNPLHFLGATAAMFAFTGLYIWLGMLIFQTRDL